MERSDPRSRGNYRAVGMTIVHIVVLWVAVLPCLSLATPARAQTAKSWAGVQASSEGILVEAGRDFGARLSGRLFVAGYELDRDFTAGSVEYLGIVDLRSFGLIVDLSPSGGSFHVSAGLVSVQHEAHGRAPVLEIARGELGDEVVDLAIEVFGPDLDFGTLEGRADYASLAPYASVGWRTGSGRRGFGFALDLGIVFVGDPEVDVTLSTALPLDRVPGATAILDAFLLEQERLIEDELDKYQVFPVVRVGIVYRF